jgi:hypothetical protein
MHQLGMMALDAKLRLRPSREAQCHLFTGNTHHHQDPDGEGQTMNEGCFPHFFRWTRDESVDSSFRKVTRSCLVTFSSVKRLLTD